ncbi:MDR family MFS transporter [Streptomyces sp. NPDC059740]|uniref:MDR family MFS transporter n=1 Tax=Streptomyces sp. NPDC059740 TaxID=3346926 RepID=UPI003653AEFB
MSETSAPDRLEPAVRKLIGILLVGLVAVLLDTTIVNVAVDRLIHDLHTTVSTVQWVSTGFLLALAMAIPLTAWAIGRFGARQVWLLGVALFLVGSVLAGVAWDIGSLIVFRVLQGLGGGLMLPVQQTLLVQAAGPKRLGRVMAAIGLPAVIIPILGPVVGGLIVSNASWRWVFFLNVPFSVVAFYLAWRGLPAGGARNRQPLDVLGLALITPGLAAILYALSQVAAHGTVTQPAVLLPLVAGLLLLAGFVVHALRTSGRPMVDVRLFTDRPFALSCGLLFLSGLSLYGVALLLPLFYQQVRGQSALVAGLMLAPQGVGSLIARNWVGRLSDRLGPRPVVVAGAVCAVLGSVPYLWAGVHGDVVVQGAGLLVRGVGLSGVNIAVMVAAYRGLRPEQVPHASSATRILMQVGGSFGVAVAALILQHELTARAVTGAAARATAYDHSFAWLLGLTAVALLPAVLLPGRAREAADAGPSNPSSPAEAPAAR